MPSDKSALLQPIEPARQRTTAVVERITAEIAAGKLAPGARLPTEQEMMTAFGVSRTVVREAVAALRAEGLVVTRQGSGAFVTADAGHRPFRLDRASSRSLPQVLEVLELRRAVEVEAAALAAKRGTAASHRRIQQAHRRFEQAVERGEPAIREDFAFHRSIAQATGNPQFLHFLEFLGGYIIPRQSVRDGGMSADDHAAYLTRLIEEHARICTAICERRPADASIAMREHLQRSSERYERYGAPFKTDAET